MPPLLTSEQILQGMQLPSIQCALLGNAVCFEYHAAFDTNACKGQCLLRIADVMMSMLIKVHSIVLCFNRCLDWQTNAMCPMVALSMFLRMLSRWNASWRVTVCWLQLNTLLPAFAHNLDDAALLLTLRVTED